MVLHLQPFWILMHVFGSLHWPVCLTRSFAASLWARGSSSFGPIFTSMVESFLYNAVYVLFLTGMVWNYSCRFLPQRLLNCSTHRATCKGVEHLSSACVVYVCLQRGILRTVLYSIFLRQMLCCFTVWMYVLQGSPYMTDINLCTFDTC